jgi:hypothetical protein
MDFGVNTLFAGRRVRGDSGMAKNYVVALIRMPLT